MQPAFARLGDDMGDRCGQFRIAGPGAFQHLRAGFRDQVARGLLVEHAERRRNVGLGRSVDPGAERHRRACASSALTKPRYGRA